VNLSSDTQTLPTELGRDDWEDLEDLTADQQAPFAPGGRAINGPVVDTAGPVDGSVAEQIAGRFEP
jgi:hypothetical protein